MNNDGNPGNFKGFDGTANKNVNAPYIVGTKHNEKAWEDFNKKEEEKAEEEKPEDGKPAESTENKAG